MSTWETFLFGALGGSIAYVTVFVLPELRRWIEKGTGWQSHFQFYAALMLLALYLVMAGLFAIFIGGATEPKHAIAYGIAWEAGFKGLATGAESLKSLAERL